MAASQEDARNVRRERVQKMTELNSSLLFSLLEWGAETNYSIQTVTATVLKYPLQILEGVYTNLCAAREDFRAKNKFRRRRRRRRKRRKNKQARGDEDDEDEVDPASVTTTTRLQFLEQEILRLRAAMEKEVAVKEDSPVKATFIEDENQAANDAAAAAAVAAVAAAMANVAAAQTTAGQRTPPRKSNSSEIIETPSQDESISAHSAIVAAVAAATAQANAAASDANTTPGTSNLDSPSARSVDNFDTGRETIRRDGLICLQDIRSGVQLRKPRQRRPSKKALAKTTPTNPRRMTIADLIRESNAKIGAAMRMHEWSPEDDHQKDNSPSMAQWDEESLDSPAMGANTNSRIFSPVSYSASGVYSPMPAAKASVPPPTQQNAVSSSIPAIPAPPPPASSDMASSAQNVPAVPITAPNSAPPPPPSNTKVVPRRSFAINGADFLQQKSALKKARPRRQRNNKQQSKGKQKLTANATPKKMSLADALKMQHKKVKGGMGKRQRKVKKGGKNKASTSATAGILETIQNARSGLKKTPQGTSKTGISTTDTTKENSEISA